MSHTPGPWSLLVDGPDLFQIVGPTKSYGFYGGYRWFGQDDARLIAAAPDYWAAAEQLSADAGELQGDDAGYVAVPKDAFDALMAAHRKAEGR